MRRPLASEADRNLIPVYAGFSPLLVNVTEACFALAFRGGLAIPCEARRTFRRGLNVDWPFGRPVAPRGSRGSEKESDGDGTKRDRKRGGTRWPGMEYVDPNRPDLRQSCADEKLSYIKVI